MRYRVQKPGVLKDGSCGYLFSGSYGSRWSKEGKTWSLPRNVVFAVERSSSDGVRGTQPYSNPLPPRGQDTTTPPWVEWRRQVAEREAGNWRASFHNCMVEVVSPGEPQSYLPLWEFLRDNGGTRWRELKP